MGARSRTNDIRHTLIGSVTNELGDVLGYQDGTLGLYRICNDVVGNRDGFNNLFIDSQHTQGGILSGVRRNGITHIVERSYNDLPVEALRHSMIDPSDAFPMGPLELNGYAMKVLAKSSPNASEVNVPQFLAELRDLPGMIKTWGSYFTKPGKAAANAVANEARRRGDTAVANAVLTYRWGIAPLISDLRKLLDIQAAIQRRFNELDRMRKGMKVRKRVHLDSGKVTADSSRFVVQSWQVLFDGYWSDTSSHNVWGSVQWYTPNWTPGLVETDEALMRRARQLALGLNSGATIQALWELLPWSWLADWFSNVGDIIAANANATGLDFRGLCIMQHLKSERTLKHNDLHWDDYELSMSPLVVHREKKYRFANVYPVAFPSLRLPILSYGKLSIIGSLAVLRFPEWFKFKL